MSHLSPCWLIARAVRGLSVPNLTTAISAVCAVHTWSVPQECRCQVFLDDDMRCFRRQFATDQIQAFGGIEQKGSYVVRREHVLCDKLAHQSLQNENVDFAVSERHCLFDHRDLPDLRAVTLIAG